MNPAILARLFQAHADAVGSMQQDQQPLDLQQEPGDLWAPKQDTGLGDLGPDVTAQRQQSIGDESMPPSDYKYLDRVEGDGRSPLGVMFGQDAGEPMGDPQNVPMGQLPQGAQEGQYISPLDIKSRRMSSRGR